MPAGDVRYLVFDLESVADGELVSKLRYPAKGLSPVDAVRNYRAERLERYDSDFIPYTYHLPVSLVVAKVAADFRLLDIVALDEPEFRPHVITENFWRGWEGYHRPVLVSFNGRTFDIPVMELSAFRYGISVPGWFQLQSRSFEQPRYRYNVDAHFDLQELLTNFGSTRFAGGLNLASNLLGKPGKMDVEGYMVQDLYDAGELVKINDYCRCDVLDTYFVFLRVNVLLGRLTLEQEQQIVEHARQWIDERSDQPAYQLYLQHWADWDSPWDGAG